MSFIMFQVREDVPVGFVVGNVVTSDAADGDNLVSGRAGGGHVMYTLTSLSPQDGDDAFDMDRSTGSLVVARQLDRETQPEYRLEVRALDTSTSNNPQSSAVVVRVDISDVNDNAPRWAKDPIVLSVPEDAAVGSAVWNFTASDADAGSNGELRYSLVDTWPKTADPVFSVDPLTGTLTLLSQLDYETLSEYTLVVRVTDQASNVSDRLSSSLTVRILIQDANDNRPLFVSPSKVIHIADGTEPGLPLTRVIAVDRDFGENARVTYVISAGNEDSKFSLGYTSGVLSLTRPLSSVDSTRLDTAVRYHLNITASDHGTPSPRHTTTSLTLLVQGTTEAPPRFVHTIYHASILEDASLGSFVVNVDAGPSSAESGKSLPFLSFPSLILS